MIKVNLIETTQTQWSSPIIFAPNIDGYLRVLIDYRKLKDVNVRESYHETGM